MSDLHPEYRAEINRYEERLISIRSEVDDLLLQKGVHTRDIEVKEKHIEYLKDVEGQREAEIARKEETIKGLDAQVETLQGKHDELQHENGLLATLVEEQKEKLVAIERDIVKHDKRMNKETEIISEKHREADEKVALVKSKEEKLRNVLAEL